MRRIDTQRALDARERRELAEELGVIAGGVADDTTAPEVFFLDPSAKTEQYGGPDGWAQCVKGYLNARGFGASVAVAPSRESALEAARSKWGVVVIHSAAGLPSEPAAARPGPASGERSAPVREAPLAQGQLGLPGLKLGKVKRGTRKVAKAPITRQAS